jgi:hypothetical protein
MFGFTYLIIVASVTATTGMFILIRRISLFTRGIRVTGFFTRWESRGIRRKFYHPVVRFTANDGKEYAFVGDPGSTKKKEKRVYGVIYPPDSPQKAVINSFLAFWAAPLALFVLSAGAAIAAFQQLSK